MPNFNFTKMICKLVKDDLTRLYGDDDWPEGERERLTEYHTDLWTTRDLEIGYLQRKSKAKALEEHPEWSDKEKVKDMKFITFRPDENCTFENFWNGIQGWIQRKWIKEFKLVFEQKGENLIEMGKGFHIHAIIKHTRNKSIPDMCIDIQEIMRKCCCTFNNGQPDIKPIKTTADLNRCNNYMAEYKGDEPLKKIAFDCDEPWRNSMGLRRFYDIAPMPNYNKPAIIVNRLNSWVDSTIVEHSPHDGLPVIKSELADNKKK